MKKVITIIISSVLALCIGVFVFTAVDRGECGDNVKWSYNSFNKTITVSGEGEMYNYNDMGYDPPWFEKYRQSVDKVVIKSGVTSVGDYAFDGMGIKTVSLPEGITYIGKSAFAFAEMTQLSLPSGLTKIGEGAFIGNTITELTVPESVSEMGPWAFRHCEELTSAVIKGNITVLEEESFALCETMTVLTLPATLKVIKDGALMNCEAMEKIIFEGTEQQWRKISVAEDNDLSGVVIECTG